MNSTDFAMAQTIDTETDSLGMDGYARRGVVLSRDAAHVVIASLRRDAFDMRARGGVPNSQAARQNEALAKNISLALLNS